MKYRFRILESPENNKSLIKAYHGSYQDIKNFSSDKTPIFFSDSIKLASTFQRGEDGYVYECELSPNNLKVFDAQNKSFNNLTIDGEPHKNINDLVDKFKGYCDCLQINNVYEHGILVVTDYIVFDASIIKIICKFHEDEDDIEPNYIPTDEEGESEEIEISNTSNLSSLGDILKKLDILKGRDKNNEKR